MDIIEGVQSWLSSGKTEVQQRVPTLDNSGTKDNIFANKTGAAYSVLEGNWYSAKPYGFRATFRNGSKFTMFLPISPSNLTITTNFATNIIPTLYGTVEEHSPVRYYDIQIEGTTGISPKYVDITTNRYPQPATARRSFPIAQGLRDQAGGFFAKALGTLDKIVQSGRDFLNGSPKPKTGLYTGETGYLAFHNLYRFLLKYKEDAAGSNGSTSARKSHPLTFFNYKDNNEYDVAVRTFTLRRSADNPMLYNYSIILRAYNLRTVNQDTQILDTTSARLAELGLDGVKSSSLLSQIKGKADKVKGVLGPLGAGINILGR